MSYTLINETYFKSFQCKSSLFYLHLSFVWSHLVFYKSAYSDDLLCFLQQIVYIASFMQ